MQSNIIHSLTEDFESFAKKTDEGLEFWLARDLQKLLGYAKWDNFKNVIKKAKISCKTAEASVSDHFADIGKTIEMPKGAKKIISGVSLGKVCEIIKKAFSKKEKTFFS